MTGAGGDDATRAVASRLGLPRERDQWNQPWRYWALRYLAALAEIADFESTTFGREEARAALETLRDDCDDLIKLLAKRPTGRWRWRRRR